MAKLFRTFALVLAALFALSLIVGCGGDDEGDDAAAAAEFSSANPAGGSEIAANATTEEKPEVSTIPLLGKEDLLGSWKLISIFGTTPAAYLESLTIGGETEVTIKQFDYVFTSDDQWTVNYASETVAIFPEIPRTNITLGGTWSGTWVFDGLTLSLNVEDDDVEVAAEPKDFFEMLEQTEEELKQTYNESFRADFLKPFEKSTCTKQADTLILITSAGEKMVLEKQ